LAGLLKGCLSRYWLRLPVVELALRVNMQPASRVAVLVALDLAGLALPLVVWRFIWQGRLDWSIVTMLDLDNGADVFWCVDVRLGKNLAA
jgi:hypothetical protein